jgi:hypothetical protein
MPVRRTIPTQTISPRVTLFFSVWSNFVGWVRVHAGSGNARLWRKLSLCGKMTNGPFGPCRADPLDRVTR